MEAIRAGDASPTRMVAVVVLPPQIHTPHPDTHHRTISRTPVGYMIHALWHYAFLCQKEQGSYCICKTIIANTMAPIIVSAPCKTIIAMQAGCWG